MNKLRWEQGVSLLEALVVLTLFGLMASTTLSFMASSSRAYAESSAISERTFSDERLDMVLNGLVAFALPPSRVSEVAPGRPKIAMAGKPAAFRFEAKLPAVLGGTLASFELGFNGKPPGMTLTLSWHAEDVPETSVVLLTDLAAGQFSYLQQTDAPARLVPSTDADPRHRVSVVHLEWTSTDPGRNGRRDVSLVITRNQWCAFDAVTLDCRG